MIQAGLQTTPPERAGRPADADLAARREGLAAAAAGGLWPTDPLAEERLIDGVRTLWFHPPGPPRAVVLHLHGGAFRIGCPEQVGPFAAALASRCQVSVCCPAYRLAPEHPFPAGLHDARTVLAALLAGGERKIILSGDSAGGGLAASLTALAPAGAPLAGLILLSPWLDLTLANPCYDANAASDPLFSLASASVAAELYLQGQSPDHPLASPLLGPVDAFPSTFISAGAGEVLVGDARAFEVKLSEAGVTVWLDVVAGMEHVAVTRSLALPGAAETFEAVADFVAGLTESSI